MREVIRRDRGWKRSRRQRCEKVRWEGVRASMRGRKRVVRGIMVLVCDRLADSLS